MSGYDDKKWSYCYNTAYIILGNDKAPILLEEMKKRKGLHAFVSGSEKDFRFMMKNLTDEDEKIHEMVEEFVKGVNAHNDEVDRKRKERFERWKKRKKCS